jgi:hypothetical protein
MSEYKYTWSFLREKSFSPPQSRWLLWVGVGLVLQAILLMYFFLQGEFTPLCILATFCSGAIVILSAKEGGDYFTKELKDKKEIESEKKLWEARFQTIKEKMEKERELLEGENEIWRSEIEENKEYIASLRRLASTISRDLQEKQGKLEGQEEVKKKRRERNETLLATSGKGAIVLKDLAKGLK